MQSWKRLTFWLYNYSDQSVTDESYVDETRVLHYNPGTFDNYYPI